MKTPLQTIEPKPNSAVCALGNRLQGNLLYIALAFIFWVGSPILMITLAVMAVKALV